LLVAVVLVALHSRMQVLVVAVAVKLQLVREVLLQTRHIRFLLVEVERLQQEALALVEMAFGQELLHLAT
jgi:hypothetical protein